MTLPVGYALSIAGCPYLFTTGPLPLRARSVLTSDERDARPWWFYETGTVTVALGYLDTPDQRWAETAKPLDGDLDCDSLTFRLHDAATAGHPLLTWLATRSPDVVASSPLAASVTASATTWTVGSGGVFVADTFAWLNRECVRVTAVAGNNLTVVRGQLGTRARAHTVDAGAALFPEVFTALPWITRRKVVLWAIAPDGTPHALWAGLAVRSPKLADDGARFELPCDALWPVLRAGSVGEPSAPVALVGYGRTGRSTITAAGDSLLRVTLQYLDGSSVLHTIAAAAQGAWRDWASMSRAFTANVEAAAAAQTQVVRTTMRRSSASATVQFGLPAAGWAARLVWLGESASGALPLGGAATSAVFDLERVPSVGYVVAVGTSTTWCLSSIAGLPLSWATEVDHPENGLQTTRTVGLRVAASKDCFIGLQAITADTSEGPRITGLARFYPRALGLELANVQVVRDPPPAQVYREVMTDHWAYGLRYGVLDLVADSDGETDFDWTQIGELTALTEGLQVSRDWIFDGRRTLGSVATECCQLFGCSPVIRAGRLALWPWRWPRADEDPVWSYGPRDLLGTPSWRAWEEGLANKVAVKSTELALTATVADSVARYGPGRSLAIELAGIEDQASIIGDPVAFSRAVLARLDLWSEPLAVVRFAVPFTLENLARTQQGNVVGLSEWLVPNGAGGRGLSETRLVVVARAPDLSAGALEVTGLVFPRTSHGYAPCVRIKGRHSGSSTVFEIDTTYVQGTTDYADSPTRGVEYFRHADAVELIERDTTTDHRESAVVFAVNTGGSPPTIELDTAPSGGMLAAIDAGALVDIRFDHYSATAQWQRGWMFVGSETLSTIDGTADRARRIAP